MLKETYRRIEREVQSFYDATPYDTCHRDQAILAFMSETEEQFLAPRNPSRILDIGCGVGLILSFLSKAGYVCHGLDISRITASIARVRYGLEVVQGSNLNLPFKDHVADVVISHGVLHHTADPCESFRELARILKPGGIIIAQIYNRGAVYYVLYSTLGRLFRSLEHNTWEQAILRRIAVPLFFAVGHIWAFLHGQRIPKKYGDQAWNHFRDFFLSPQVKPCTFAEIQDWSRASHLKLLSYQTKPAIHSVVLEKPTV